MKPKSQQARRRLNLWLKDPHCFWCERLTVLPPNGGGALFPHHATLDHILSRNVRLPGEQFNCGENTVLACHQCNNERNREELDSIPVEERRKAAQNGHRKAGLTSTATLSPCIS